MRMRQSPATAPNVGKGRLTQPPPAHVGEPAAVRDDQIGLIFRNMRLAMKVPRETIARRLATSAATIDNLEAGAIAALPHWKETSRIIRAYCELLRMDCEPILWRMRELLQAPPTEVRTASTSQQARSWMEPSRSSAQRGRTRIPVDIASGEPASTGWRNPTSAPSGWTSAHANGVWSGCFGIGSRTQAQVSTVPPGPTSPAGSSRETKPPPAALRSPGR